MKKLLALTLAMVLCLSLCACSSSKGTRGVSEKSNVNIETKAVDIAIENWINSNAYMFIYDDYKFTISSKEENNMISGNGETGNSYQYYNVKGNVKFYDEYDELVREGKFTVVYANDGERFFVADERTIIQ